MFLLGTLAGVDEAHVSLHPVDLGTARIGRESLMVR